MKDVGLVLVQHAPIVAHDPLISGVERGLEDVLLRNGLRLVTRVVPDAKAETAVYRHWCATGAVDAVVLVRLQHNDVRIPFLRELGLPFVAVADERQIADFSAVVTDSVGAMRSVVEYLVERGHHRVAYASGPADAAASSIRADAFESVLAEHGGDGIVMHGEHTQGDGVALTLALLAADPRPTAIVFDDDVTAAAGVETITGNGLRSPEDVAVVAWNDSVLCQSAVPPITAMGNAAHAVGALVGSCLLQLEQSGPPVILHAPPASVVRRASA